VALNFDAQINVDVAPFLANIERAKGAVQSLNAEINALNAKKVSAQAGASAASSSKISSEANARKAAANAAMQAMAQETQMARAMGQTERNNAKVELQAEAMRKSALDSRVKDHRTISNLFDDTIAMRDRESKNFSNSLKAELQGREQMNKLHGQALAINARRDAALANGANANVRNLARERYALYDVAAAYQQIAGIAASAITAMAGTAIAYERSFADVQRTTEFTSVKVGEAARVMKYSLMEVAAEIPVAFGKITEIATIANQLGVAQGEVAKFSKTVAQFATTTGMTVQATAMAFGRIGELTTPAGAVADYNALASSIAYAGVKAVATEEQIVSVTKEIATTAKMAKFTTPEIVGLATALSSVGIAPEAARGSIMRTFAGINEAVSKGGAVLENYASISGMSAAEFSKSWTENGQVAFDGFIKGLQAMSDSGQNLDSVLRGIGLKNVRDIQTIQKLGDNYNVYADSIRNASQAYYEGTFISTAYAKIQETVAAKLELVKNNWDNFLAGLGESATGDIFKALLDGITSALKGLTDMSRSPVGYWLGAVLTTVSLLAVAIGTMNGALALGRAAMLAFSVAMNATTVAADGTTVAINRATLAKNVFFSTAKATGWLVAIGAIIQGLALLSEALSPIEAKAESALGGFSGLQDALTKDYAEAIKVYGSDTKVAMAIASGAIDGATVSAKDQNSAYADAITQASNLALISGTSLPNGIGATTTALAKQNIVLGENYTKWLQTSIQQSKAFQGIAKDDKTSSYLKSVGYSFDEAAKASRKGGAAVDQYFNNIEAKGKKLGLTAPTILKSDWWNGFDFPLQMLKDTFKGTANESYLLGVGLGKLGDAASVIPKTITPSMKDLAKATKQTVKTVVDYASQMISIFKRIDDIKFNNPLMKNSVAADEIAAAWTNIKEQASGAADAIVKAQQSIDELSSDKRKLEYQLSVAVRYGDTKREAALRAQLAKKTTEIADAEKAKTKAQDESSKSLTDNTAAGAKNRAGLVDMLSKYQSYIGALAATGVKGTALETIIADLKKEFIDQGTELGYNTTELGLFSDQFDEYAKAVHSTPRDVTVEFDATKTPGFNAVQEYLAKEQLLNVKVVRSDDGTLNSINPGAGADQTVGGGGGGLTSAVPAWVAADQKTITSLEKQLEELAMQGGTIKNKLTAAEWLYDKKPTKAGADSIAGYKYALGQIGTSVGMVNGQLLKLKAKVAAAGFSAGGYVSGPGGSRSDSIPARLSNGEYVVNAAAVRTYGVDFMNTLNQMKIGSMPTMSAGNGGSASGSQVVYLSPDDRALLRAAIDRPVNLYTESSRIASSANTGNTLLAQRGLN